MSEILREQMLASATKAVNALCTWAHDEPMADFDAREEHILNVGRELLATWLGPVGQCGRPRTPACPKCGVHSLTAIRAGSAGANWVPAPSSTSAAPC
jgi:hypothetical protein